MNSPAPRDTMPLGYGVPTIQKPKPRHNVPQGTSVVVLDETDDCWSDTPTIPDQISEPEYWKSDGIEAKVFDLSNEAQLQEYNKLLTAIDKPNTNKLLRDHKVESFPAAGTWKVFVLVQTVKFRKLILKRDSNKPES